MPKKRTHEEYATLIEGKGIYPVETYLGSQISILHRCLEGHEWYCAPTNLISRKTSGCPHCKGVARKTNEQYLKELSLKQIHTKPIEKLINMSTPIKHRCVNGHEWRVKPTHILNTMTGCPQCSTTWGFKPFSPAILYYIKMTKQEQTYYKIGVTNKTVQDRFKEEKNIKIEILKEIRFKTGEKAKAVERRILNKYPGTNDKSFISSGYSELFEYDLGYR